MGRCGLSGACVWVGLSLLSLMPLEVPRRVPVTWRGPVNVSYNHYYYTVSSFPPWHSSFPCVGFPLGPPWIHT